MCNPVIKVDLENMFQIEGVIIKECFCSDIRLYYWLHGAVEINKIPHAKFPICMLKYTA